MTLEGWLTTSNMLGLIVGVAIVLAAIYVLLQAYRGAR